MLSKLNSLREKNEDGFTLIELLIVVVIIGILAAIAIPIFLNQQKAAIAASVKSDVRNTVTNVATALVKEPNAYFTGTPPTGTTLASPAKVESGTNVITITGNWQGYGVVGSNSALGTAPTSASNAKAGSGTGYAFLSADGKYYGSGEFFS